MVNFHGVITMYNAEIKKQFIENSLGSYANKSSAKRFFDFTEPMETELGKDIAEMTKSEATEILEGFNVNSLGSLFQYRFIVQAYLKWCAHNNVFNNVSLGFSAAFDPNNSAFNDAGRVFLRDPLDLYESIREVREIDNGYVEPPILALGWVGVDKEDIFILLDSQVDLQKRKVYDINGNTIASWYATEISRILEKYVECNVGIRQNKNATFKVGKDPTRKEFLKKFAPISSKRFGEPYTAGQLNSALNKFADAYQESGHPNRLVFKNVWESGRLYSLFLLEQAGINVFSEENAGKVLEIYRNSKTLEKILWAYKAYKRNFNLE